jgi:hypothetical protein
MTINCENLETLLECMRNIQDPLTIRQYLGVAKSGKKQGKPPIPKFGSLVWLVK